MQSPEDQVLALYRRFWVTTERRSPDTVDHYLSELRQLSDTTDRSLLELDRLAIEDWVAERTERSSHTGRWAYRAVRSFYRWATDREIIDSDPTEKITAPKEVKNPTPNTITVDAFEHLLATIDGDSPFDVRDRAIIETLWATGLRRGELLRMELHHVDLDAATIIIPITKTKRPRVVPVTRRALDAISAWLETRYQWQPGELIDVWISRWNGNTVRLTENGLRMMLERRGCSADLRISAHAFRRGVAAHLLRSGVSQVSVENVLGWAPGSPMAASYVRTVAAELSIDEYRRKIG